MHHIRLFVLLTLFFNLVAHIEESDNLACLRAHLDQDTLVIFDIDNTLAHPKGVIIGSDEWFCHMIEHEMQKGNEFIKALNNILPIYYEVQLQVSLQTIEDTTPQLLQDLQNEGVAIMALTARSLPLVNRTIHQLRAIDIDFSHNHLGPVYAIRQAPHLYMYKRGILFSGDNNKGDALMDFLAFCAYKPKRIIFIDDKMKNLHAVEAAVEEHGIEFIGIRYSKLDAYVAAFDADRAMKELDAFHHL